MKFLHAADLHIDSPLRGLDLQDSAHADRLRRATREAFTNLLSLAIAEAVDFIIIAGDLFDGEWPDMRTGLWTAEQFRRLREHNIRVYLIRGNHDAHSIVAKELSNLWPRDVVCEFPANAPGSFTDERSGVVLHGQSYAERQTLRDLAATYPPAVRGAFNIGVLHTSLTGDPNHDTYAPTTTATLVDRGYGYWALGHIHQRQIVHMQPFIVFSGNTQGRHIKEQGAKGCYLVAVSDGKVAQCVFHTTDVVRWSGIELSLDNIVNEDQLLEALNQSFRDELTAAEGRPVVTRVSLRGASALHQVFSAPASRDRLLAAIRNQANDFDGEVWIEQIVCATQPEVDIAELRQAGDIVGDFLRALDELRADPAQQQHLAESLRPLFKAVGDALGHERELSPDDPAARARWLSQAENLLLAKLTGGSA